MPAPAEAALNGRSGVIVKGSERFERDNRTRVSGPGMRTFLNVAEKWGLNEQERIVVLGYPGRSTYHQWARKARAGEEICLPADMLTRISLVLGIHKALRIIFLTDDEGIAWLKQPNAGPTFNGARPMDLLLAGTQDGLYVVRRYLDAWRGGIFAAPNAADAAPPITDDDLVFV